jgi:hypothetical protein
MTRLSIKKIKTIFLLVVQIDQNKDNNLEVNNGRIIESLLTLLQKALQETVVLYKKTGRRNTADIESDNEIIFNDKFYTLNSDNPTRNKKRLFLSRLCT